MRRWKITRGNYVGEHFIYETEEEALEKLGLVPLPGVDPFPHWADEKVMIGWWVRTCDGRICQVLNRWDLVNNHGQRAFGVRLCFGTGRGWIRKDGTRKYWLLHADFKSQSDRQISRNSLGGDVNHGMRKYLTTAKRLFAYYCVELGNPIKAFTLAYPRRYNAERPSKIAVLATELMHDKYVFKEIMSYMKQEDYRNKLKATLEAAGLNDAIGQSVVRGLAECKPGTTEHANFIIMALKLQEIADDALLLRDGADSKQLMEHIEPHKEIKDRVATTEVTSKPEADLPDIKDVE